MTSKKQTVSTENNPQSLAAAERSAKKKNARIVCVNENEFWTTQKQFWQWVREGLVEVTGQRPLTGRFGGKREKLLVMIRHVILDNGSPAHKQEVLGSYDRLKPHTSKLTSQEREKISKKENR
jgi:hypothetical protein